MNPDETNDSLEEQEEEPAYPVNQKLTCAMSTAVLMGLADWIAHFGPTGLVVGGLASYVAWKHGPELYEQVRGSLPRPVSAQGRREQASVEQTAKQPATKRGWWERAFAIPAQDEQATRDEEDEEQDEDTVLVAERDLPTDERWTHWLPPDRRRSRLPTLDLSPDLRVPVGDLAGKAILICAIRRQGKTTLGALLAEQLGQYDLPMVIPDLEGDYLSLAEVLPRAVIAGHSRAARQYTASQFVPLDSVQAAYQLGYDTLEDGYQVLLDLSSYHTLEEGLAVQINVLRGLLHWTNTHPDERVPCHVYLDEAQRYLPQTLSDSIILDKTVLTLLLKSYMDILGIGGKRGLAPVILTQRMAQVNNKIMAQSEVFFLLRQTHDTDLDRCMEYVDKKQVTKEQLARFQPGQGVYISSDGTQLVTRFHPRRSSGERSASPRPEAAARYAHMPVRLRTVAAREAIPSADQSWQRVSEPPAVPCIPQLEPARPQPSEPTPPVSIKVAFPPAERKPQPALKDAIVCWNELVAAGQNPSRNNLQQALIAKGFECRENWARKFYEDIKDMLSNQPQQDESAGG